ncbi:MAG: putative metal-binding motif-containing protein [Myxococcota bacterium]|nr:putative metal-binding motif-containing protein [Myxococcota bacterium]
MRICCALVFVSLSLGCSSQKGQIFVGQSETGPQETGLLLDEDGDGVSAAEDCDDNNEEVYPGAQERCDGIDNNCDGLVDGAD